MGDHWPAPGRPLLLLSQLAAFNARTISLLAQPGMVLEVSDLRLLYFPSPAALLYAQSTRITACSVESCCLLSARSREDVR